MGWHEVWRSVLERLGASLVAQEVSIGAWTAAAAALAALCVATPLWAVVRPLVTVVHELGHAVVGVLCGRRFTGFVVNPDMSGHTVTAGRPRGIGLVLTTVAGYPMPAAVGAVMIAAAMGGRAPLILVTAGGLMIAALVRARSLYTALALVTLLAATGAAWWRGSIELTSAAVCGAGVVLLVGAWRQLVSVVVHGGRADDPGALASLTRAPRWIWHLVMLVLIVWPTWWSASALAPAIRALADHAAG